jgi:hypothetical protein
MSEVTPLSDMTEAELGAYLKQKRAEEPEPIHTWFELSYSSYLVLPRSILQSMPTEWQRRFVDCLHEAREAAEPLKMNDRYTVLLRGERGRIVSDPYCNYERGRRRVALRLPAPPTLTGEATKEQR